jgi:hypothetical protein
MDGFNVVISVRIDREEDKAPINSKINLYTAALTQVAVFMGICANFEVLIHSLGNFAA